MSHVCRTLAMALISYRVCVFVCGRIVWMTSTLLDNVNISSFAIVQRVCHNLNALARHSVVMRTKKWRMCSLHISNHYQFSRQPHTKHAAWRKILFFFLLFCSCSCWGCHCTLLPLGCRIICMNKCAQFTVTPHVQWSQQKRASTSSVHNNWVLCKFIQILLLPPLPSSLSAVWAMQYSCGNYLLCHPICIAQTMVDIIGK